MKVDLNNNHHMDGHRRNVRNAVTRHEDPEDLTFWQHIRVRGKTREFWLECAGLLIGGALLVWSLCAMGQLGR